MMTPIKVVTTLSVAFAALAFSSAASAQTCGSAHGKISLGAPTTGLCTVGFASGVSGTGPFTWTCSQFSGFPPLLTSVSCSALPHCHDLDGNGQLQSTTDSVMITRIMLGMTGTAVTANAVAAGAPRSTWPVIRTFLNTYCGHAIPENCVPNGGTISVGTQPNLDACIDAVFPLQTQCCGGTFTLVTYDNPLGSNSCIGTCGPQIGAANPRIESQ